MPKLTFFLSSFFYNVALQACLTTELLSQWVVPQDGLLKFCGESPYTLRLGNYIGYRPSLGFKYKQKQEKSFLDCLK